MSIRRYNIPRIMYVCLVGSMLCAAAPADLYAAMAPQYERVRQFDFVMSTADEAAARLFPHGPIDRIERMDDGTFRFWAKRCFVPVTLESLPAAQSPPQAGTPTDYRIALGDVDCD